MAKIVNKKYETSEHVVAFIDILGAKKMIEEDENKNLNDIHTVFEKMLKLLDNKDIASVLKVKIFSDNIIIAFSTHLLKNKKVDYTSALFHALLAAAGLQVQFLQEGILVRGAITVGNLFIDEVMVFGKALLNAYKLEVKNAIYPRIIIDPKVIPQIKKNQPDDPFTFLKKDIDSFYYVNYFNDFFNYDKSDVIYLLNDLIQESKDKIVKYSDDLSIKQKWEWHKQYLIDTLKDMEGKNEK